MLFCLQGMLEQQWHKGGTNQYQIHIKAHFTTCDPYMALFGNNSQGTLYKTKYWCSYYFTKQNKTNKTFTFCYTHRTVPCAAIIRETSSCCIR